MIQLYLVMEPSKISVGPLTKTAFGASIKKSEFLSKAVSPKTLIKTFNCSKVIFANTTLPFRFSVPISDILIRVSVSTFVQLILSITRVQSELMVALVFIQLRIKI